MQILSSRLSAAFSCALTATLFVGCASNEPIKMKGGGIEMSVDIRLMPEGLDRLDEYKLYEGFSRNEEKVAYFEVNTGPVWAAIFSGSENSPATFHIDSAKLEAYYCGYGCGRMYTYTISGMLDCKGTNHPIVAEASENVAWVAPAMQISVEQAILKVAREAELKIKRCNNQAEPDVDLYDELIKLDELRQKGIITDEEFEIEKKKILRSDE